MANEVVAIVWKHGDTYVEDWTFVQYLVQTLTVEGVPTAGTLTLTFEGEVTAPLVFNATAAQVQTALEGLPSVGPGDVTVTGGPLPDLPLTITVNRFAANPILVSHALTGGSNVSAYIRGQPYDLTGATLRWTAKLNINNPDPGDLQHVSGDPGITVTDALGGRIRHTITAVESAALLPTAPYQWDVQITAADGTVATPMMGTFLWTQTVTQTR